MLLYLIRLGNFCENANFPSIDQMNTQFMNFHQEFFLDSVCFRPHFYKKHYYFYSITLLPGALMTLCLFSLPTFEFYEAHATFRRVKEKKRTNHSTLQQNLKAPIKNYFYFSLHSHAFIEWSLHFSCLFFNSTWLFLHFLSM